MIIRGLLMLDYHENLSFLIATVHQLLSLQEKFPGGRNLAISQLAELTNRRGDVFFQLKEGFYLLNIQPHPTSPIMNLQKLVSHLFLFFPWVFVLEVGTILDRIQDVENFLTLERWKILQWALVLEPAKDVDVKITTHWIPHC